jgi:8-oxo-dGTP diphosphatase
MAWIMARFALQFGQTAPGVSYRERPCVYGVGVRGGALAVAQIGPPHGPFVYDLPGGGVEAGEDESGALIREFLEETGLQARPDGLIARAGQYWVNGEEPRNSLSAFYRVELTGELGSPAEPDHLLAWMAPLEAIQAMRHEAHAWAIAVWLRQGLT